jgi:uncharacterized protein YceH (UPF0502 family)
MELIGPSEARVLGALLEKEAATPEYYPLSLNALLNACNQKSNRFPVVDYDEETVTEAIDALRHKRYAAVIVGSGRVNKYGQRISETLNLGRRELAALCVLLLRGPQTLGEIKDRSERMYSFGDLEETERVLEKMAELPSGAMARKLPRMPGHKEARYVQLLTGEPAAESEGETVVTPHGGRVTQLEGELAALKSEMAELRKRLETLEDLMR